MEGLNRLGLSLYNVGTSDLLLGEKELRSLMDHSRFPWLSANLQTAGGSFFTRRALIREEDGLRVGYFGLLAAAALQEEPGRRDEFRVLEPLAVAREMTAYLRREECDLVVALTSLGLEEDRRLAAAVPGIDLVFGGFSRGLTLHPERAGNALLLQAGSKGTHLGRLEATLPPGSAQGWTEAGDQEHPGGRRFRWELVPLAQTIADDPDMTALLGRYQDELRDRALAEQAETPPPGEEPAYRGANSCATCHREIFREWLTSSHAQGFAVLERKSRSYNPECFPCHTTGYGKPTGFSSARLTPHLKGIQCEACHGPGGWHRRAGEMSRPTEILCRTCHDGENSPAFDYRAYRERLGGHALGGLATGSGGP